MTDDQEKSPENSSRENLSRQETELGTDLSTLDGSAGGEASASAPGGGGDLQPGTVLFGAYEIVDMLGSGGMGDVYRAKHLSLGGLRAIKVMHPDLHSNREAQERFHQEARALLEVHHPAVVRCHDLLRDDDGRVYLVMELIDGIALSDRMDQGPLSPDEVRALGARVASGLAAAHARGVIHRDLSPDNIVLPDGRPEQAKLIDFGIAKVLATGQETIAEGFKGKLSYASPEQLGFFNGVVDARSDYYALGLVLCAASVGEPIEMGRTFAEAVDARRDLSEVPTSVPEALRSHIEPLLAFDPDDRPESVERLFYWAGADREVGASGGMGWRAPAIAAAALLVLALVGRSFFAGDATTPEVGDVAVITDGADITQPAVGSPPPEPALAAFAGVVDALRVAGAPRDAKLGVDPTPVRDGDAYQVAIDPGCDCFALLFAIEGEGQRIDLLYPNAFDRGRRLTTGEAFGVPNSPLYTFEAVAGSGTDRLKLLVFENDPQFPPPGIDFWSATPQQTERMGQLAGLLESAAVGSADAALVPLRILR